ncbi:PD-(D/E)XK motif protein [Microbacterium sp. NPDC019599]|uniref:PD-(D/E)XK motif protein n=1 Tax=Microbacterium sp. NPDC019599 TaxID=3154690 RepID=UPI0033E5790B
MRDPATLRSAFHGLTPAAEPGSFVGSVAVDNIICARGNGGDYELFVPAASADDDPAVLRIGSMRLHSPRIYEVDVLNEKRVGPFLRLSLASERFDLLDAFLASFCACVPDSLPLAEPRSLSEQLAEILQLLQGDRVPTAGEIKGLWAELWLIMSSVDPGQLLRGWHSHPHDKVDFAVRSVLLEVKCHEGRERLHHLRLDQLQLRPDATYIVSVCVAASPSGSTIRELVSGIEARVTDVERARMARQVALVLGVETQLASEYRFEPWPDVPPIAVPAAAIPRPMVTDVLAVRDVEFVVDLSGAAGVPLADILEG